MSHAQMLKNRRKKQKSRKHAISEAKQAMDLKMQEAKTAGASAPKKKPARPKPG